MNDYYSRYSITWTYDYLILLQTENMYDIIQVTHDVPELNRCSDIRVHGQITISTIVSSAVRFVKGGYYLHTCKVSI